jgi:hypothetical protein
MASLKAHGTKIYEQRRIGARYTYMSDGHVLRDVGGGWKLWKKLKDGILMLDHVSGVRTKDADGNRLRPKRAKLRETMLTLFKGKLSTQRLLMSTMKSAAGDSAAVYAWLTDHVKYSTVQLPPRADINLLCERYRAMVQEGVEGSELNAETTNLI